MKHLKSFLITSARCFYFIFCKVAAHSKLPLTVAFPSLRSPGAWPTRSKCCAKNCESAPPEHTMDWLVDDQGRVLATLTVNEGVTTLLAPQAAAWKTIARVDSSAPEAATLRSLAAAADGHLYGERYSDDAERTAGDRA